MKSIFTEFEKFHTENPIVFKMFAYIVDGLIREGHREISADWVIGTIRVKFFSRVRKEQYKINNDFVSGYARMWRAICEHPETKLYLKLKKSKHFDTVTVDKWKELAQLSAQCKWPGRPPTEINRAIQPMLFDHSPEPEIKPE